MEWSDDHRGGGVAEPGFQGRDPGRLDAASRARLALHAVHDEAADDGALTIAKAESDRQRRQAAVEPSLE